MRRRDIQRSSTTEGLPVAPSMGPALASVDAPREEVGIQPRVLYVSVLSVGIGVAGGLVALVLFRAIGLITNLSFYGRVSWDFVAPTIERVGLWVMATARAQEGEGPRGPARSAS
jgi:chloride channel protein, CIC family